MGPFAGRVIGLVVAVAALAPGSALAADRFAENGGDGEEPCLESDPCGIFDAVEGAAFQDEVTLLGGFYSLGADTLNIPADVDVGGVPGDPVFLASSAPQYTVLGSTNTGLHDVDIAFTGWYGTVLVSDVNRVRSIGSGIGNIAGCAPDSGGSITNSICATQDSGNGVDYGVGCSGTLPEVTIRNVTAVGFDAGISASANNECQISMGVRNTIAVGAGDDVSVEAVTAFAAAEIDLDFSAFDSILETGDGASATSPGTLDNIEALPTFVSPGAADFHQTETSPTVDAGDSGGSGPLDFEGQARQQGERIDMGADEFDSVPTVKIRPIEKIVTPKKKVKVEFEFEADEPVQFTCDDGSGPLVICESPFEQKLKSGRGKGKKHTFTVSGMDGSGNNGSAATTFRIKRKG